MFFFALWRSSFMLWSSLVSHAVPIDSFSQRKQNFITVVVLFCSCCYTLFWCSISFRYPPPAAHSLNCFLMPRVRSLGSFVLFCTCTYVCAYACSCVVCLLCLTGSLATSLTRSLIGSLLARCLVDYRARQYARGLGSMYRIIFIISYDLIIDYFAAGSDWNNTVVFPPFGFLVGCWLLLAKRRRQWLVRLCSVAADDCMCYISRIVGWLVAYMNLFYTDLLGSLTAILLLFLSLIAHTRPMHDSEWRTTIYVHISCILLPLQWLLSQLQLLL